MIARQICTNLTKDQAQRLGDIQDNVKLKTTGKAIRNLIEEIKHVVELECNCEKELLRLKRLLKGIEGEKQKVIENKSLMDKKLKCAQRMYHSTDELQFSLRLGYNITNVDLLENDVIQAKFTYNDFCSVVFKLDDDLCELCEVSPPLPNIADVQDFFTSTQDIIGLLSTLKERFDIITSTKN